MELSNYFPIWNKIAPEHQQLINRACLFQKVTQGTQIHDGGADCLGLVIMKSGQLRAYILSEGGREITLSRLFEYDISILSASCVIPDMPLNIMIEAEKDSEFWSIPAFVIKQLMSESLPISNYTRDLITGNFSELMWLTEQIMWKSVDKRLAAFLLEESLLENSDLLKITHEKIANHMGTAREVVTRMLRYFQGEKMVTLSRGTIQLADRKKLESLRDL